MILYLLTICLVTSVNGLLPTSQLLIGDNIGDATILASVSLFGGGYSKDALSVHQSSDDDSYMCDDIGSSAPDNVPTGQFLFLIPRGLCSFEHKVARAEELGASAAVIYNTADAMFMRNGTSFPQDRLDYECSNGEVDVDASLLASPFYSRANDELFAPCSSNAKCSSGSATLIFLFFVNAFAFVTFMYAFGCGGALTQVLLQPLLTKAADLTGTRRAGDKVCCVVPLDIGPCSYIDVLGTAAGYALGALWYSYSLKENASDYAIYWVLQDLFGACMCVLFLSVIRLPSLRVATFLLIAAFFYDIFFVFLSPLLFNKSVMIHVATGGDGPTTDPMTCEKYPSTDGCRVPNPLPMLFSIPKIGDYQGGSSLLGLGDIVLPGLLLSFAMRYDWSKLLLRENDGGSSDDETKSKDRRRGGGYWGSVCVMYGVGLMMANVAVYAMKQGQPALLYLVPCTLGIIVYLGWKRGELGELYRGPAAMKMANNILDAIEEERFGGGGGEEGDSDVSTDSGGRGDSDGIGLLGGRV
ncbi:hypothetical protein TrRE_jg7596 [Triparma retinervis]|uniref:PA domain-containing protein n=1 Tax=Triparma retinervis TaxID=2557542 RepID=A0A9W7ABE5_9STRA|nr:hypothetical protein TrRE_jg7596 [Triparma retinervis]